MSWFWGQSGQLWEVAAKAALMYLVAVFALRSGPRRTLAQWTAIDFAAAVAVGAIIGRTALAHGQSFLIGAVALVTILAMHVLAMVGRFNPTIAKLVDHRIRVLVDHGRLRRDQLRLCGLTDNDVLSQLRQLGVHRLEELRYVLYETKGELTVVRNEDAQGELVTIGLRDATAFTPGAD